VTATSAELADEARRARKVRQLVDIATALIMQSNMTVDDAESLVAWLRQGVLALFPGGAETFELIYTPRVNRLIQEYAVGRHGRVVISFPGRRI
jgi:hypothetical protein